MKYLFFIILGFAACTLSKTSAPDAVKYPNKAIDTSRYAILKFDADSNKFIFNETVTPTSLTYYEIEKIEKLMSEAVADHDNLIRDPTKYRKQFIPVITANGDKEVWVNCFCRLYDTSYWKKHIVLVLDGGGCFFQLKINLTKSTVYDFSVNGIG